MAEIERRLSRARSPELLDEWFDALHRSGARFPLSEDERALLLAETLDQGMASEHEPIDDTTADPGLDGIPSYKLMSSDGWLISEPELRAALAKARPSRDDAIADDWRLWLAWLAQAVDHGGTLVF